MALTHNPNSEHKAKPRQVLVANPHLHGTPYDRKVALIVGGGRVGYRGLVVNEAFRQSLLGAQQSLQANPQSRLSLPKPIQLGVIEWGPGKLEEEIQSGVWMPTQTTFQTVVTSRDDLWENLVRGIGRNVLRTGLGIKRFPIDVLDN